MARGYKVLYCLPALATVRPPQRQRWWHKPQPGIQKTRVSSLLIIKKYIFFGLGLLPGVDIWDFAQTYRGVHGHHFQIVWDRNSQPKDSRASSPSGSHEHYPIHYTTLLVYMKTLLCWADLLGWGQDDLQGPLSRTDRWLAIKHTQTHVPFVHGKTALFSHTLDICMCPPGHWAWVIWRYPLTSPCWRAWCYITLTWTLPKVTHTFFFKYFFKNKVYRQKLHFMWTSYIISCDSLHHDITERNYAQIEYCNCTIVFFLQLVST